MEIWTNYSKTSKDKRQAKNRLCKKLVLFQLGDCLCGRSSIPKGTRSFAKSTLQKYNQSFDQIFKMLLNDIDKHEKEYNEAQKTPEN